MGSYTARLFNDPKLVEAKIMEEAEELCQATTKSEIASEAADLIYFALTRCIAADVNLEDVERNLDMKDLKVKRRKGDAKARWAEKVGLSQEPAPKAAPAPAFSHFARRACLQINEVFFGEGRNVRQSTDPDCRCIVHVDPGGLVPCRLEV